MDCLQLPFIREEAVSWTQRFLTRKIWPTNLYNNWAISSDFSPAGWSRAIVDKSTDDGKLLSIC